MPVNSPPVRQVRSSPRREAAGGSRPRRIARPAGDRTAAFQHLVGEVFRLNGQLLATAEALAQGLKVTPAGWQTIAILRAEPLTVADVARRLGLRRQSALHNVSRLRAQGLVRLRDNPNHRRASLAALTPAGKAMMTVLRRRQVQLTRLFLGDLALTNRDLEALAAVLRALRERGAAGAIATRPAGGSGRRRGR